MSWTPAIAGSTVAIADDREGVHEHQRRERVAADLVDLRHEARGGSHRPCQRQRRPTRTASLRKAVSGRSAWRTSTDRPTAPATTPVATVTNTDVVVRTLTSSGQPRTARPEVERRRIEGERDGEREYGAGHETYRRDASPVAGLRRPARVLSSASGIAHVLVR